MTAWILPLLLLGNFTTQSASALDDAGPAEVYVRLPTEATAASCPALQALLHRHGAHDGMCLASRNNVPLFQLRWRLIDRDRLRDALESLKANTDIQWFEFRHDTLELQTRQGSWASTVDSAYHSTLMPAMRSAEDPAFIQPGTLRLRTLLKIYRPSAPALVAVIDSGVNFESTPLSSLRWFNSQEIPGNNIDDDGNGLVDDVHGWDFVDEPYDSWFDDSREPDNDPSDRLGHGTAIANILAQAVGTDASHVLRIMPLRVASGSGGGGAVSPFALAEAIRYATAHGAQVMNISIGSVQEYAVVREAVNEALARQVVVIAAAGNTGDRVLFPANMPGVLAVGALDAQGQIWFGSAKGQGVDVFFPGTDMIHNLSGPFPLLSSHGTSLSAPLATAVAASFSAIAGHSAECSTTRQRLNTARAVSQDGGNWIEHLVDSFEDEVRQTDNLAMVWQERKLKCGAAFSVAALLRRPT